MDYHARPAIRRSLRSRRPPARFVDCMVREYGPPPPPSPTLVVSDHHQTQYENPPLRHSPSSSAPCEQPQHDLLDMDVKQEILGLKGMLGEMMSKMSQLVVSSRHSEFSESFDDASDDDDNALVNPSIVQELCACIKTAEKKPTCEKCNSSTVPSLLPFSRPSSLPLPPSSLLRSPPQQMHTHDIASQLQFSMLQPSIVPLVPGPSNCQSPQVQTSPVLVQPTGPPQPVLPCSSFSSAMVHSQLSSQVTSAQLPPQPRYAVSQYSQPLGPSSSSAIPHVASANVGPHMQSVGQVGNDVVQPPAPHIQPIVPTTQSTAIPFLHPYPYSQPYYASYPVPSYPTSRVQGPTFPFLVNDDPQEFAMLQLALTNLLSPHEPEHYKFHILLDHLKFSPARDLALAYANDPRPYSMALFALQQKYGQPHQLVLREIKAILALPRVRPGDSRAFSSFALKVRALVGMLQSSGQDQVKSELSCASHVQQLLSKLPTEHVTNFARYARTILKGQSYNLISFSAWLQEEAECQAMADQVSDFPKPFLSKPQPKTSINTRTVLYGVNSNSVVPRSINKQPQNVRDGEWSSKYSCAYCSSRDHFIGLCPSFKSLEDTRKDAWIRENKRCWRCGLNHLAVNCDLKKPCPQCKGRHLGILHGVNCRDQDNGTFYLSRLGGSGRVLLKVVEVLLHYKGRSLQTYAILDDGSERTMLLPQASESLGLNGVPESLIVRTVRQDTLALEGSSVTFEISSMTNPEKKYSISNAFSAARLGLAEQTYPVEILQRRFRHLRDLPLPAFSNVQPLVLIGADYPHLINPIDQVYFGPPKSPAAIQTRLGWVLQGPIPIPNTDETQCLFTIANPLEELRHDVEKLWKVDILPFRNEKVITRSKQDQAAMELLASKSKKVDVDGVKRYATPLLRASSAIKLRTTPNAVMSSLRCIERRLQRNPKTAAVYNQEIAKLEESGYVSKVELPHDSSDESWYIPHHIVEHNGKRRIVFNCSYQYKGVSLNSQLLPGPQLGPSLLGVLLRFRQCPVAISGDIKSMFHQVRLLPEDRSLLRFLWRNMQSTNPPDIYEWQVLPFGTVCSPCCATYALQRHVHDHQEGYEDIASSVLQSFYVDNCLESFPNVQSAKNFLDRMRSLLMSGGFEIRQWASNQPGVVRHLPPEARSENAELWINQDSLDPKEGALGLSWHCPSDSLGYRSRTVEYKTTTLRNIYKVLASQYDPLGYITPFTTRAKVIIQQCWMKSRGWDDPLMPNPIQQAWKAWETELPDLSLIQLPRCYLSLPSDQITSRELHIFCDASESAYGSVAYLRMGTDKGVVHTSFIMARSRVAPKKQISIPRLELCAALTGAQLCKLLQNELTHPLTNIVLWSDSTTVLSWLHSLSCRYKVFVANRVTEILELTDPSSWRYIPSAQNPADDITRGKTLVELAKPDHRWRQGPTFLKFPPDEWPKNLVSTSDSPDPELRKPLFCGLTQLDDIVLPDPARFKSWSELQFATNVLLRQHSEDSCDASSVQNLLLRQAQQQSFPSEYQCLTKGKPIEPQSCLLTLSPEFNEETGLIVVGGKLRRVEDMEPGMVHPIVLDPKHPLTQLIIKDCDEKLFHPGPERVFSELRRNYWIIRGRQAVKKHQWSCFQCRKWRAKPSIPQMSDLPLSKLRLFKPPFWSTGMDCFGPFHVNIGRRTEKRWGILFKCQTTRCLHLDLLSSLDVDSFLMGLRRFISRRGRPYEILCDQGSNFRGAARELKEAFQNLPTELQDKLEKQQIKFKFNPPQAPHFGGSWEREVRSVKTALRVVLGSQTVSEEVLRTVLTEVEGVLNSKPLGYASSNISDLDPITPNLLLMGRRDSSLPQVIYANTKLLGRRSWRHSQALVDQFWTSFIRHYLPGQQLRQKWNREKPNLNDSAVVLVIDFQLPRASWPIGRVVRLLPSQDGRVRVAEIDINGKTYVRPVAKLIPLPEIDE